MRACLPLFALVVACSSSSTTSTPAPGDDASESMDGMDMDAMDMDSMTAEDSATTEDTATSETGTTAAATIHVGNFYYKPKTVTVKVGDTVEWIWDGGTHSVTSGTSCTKDGKYDSGTHSTKMYKFSHTYTEAGTFGFFCDFMDHCTSHAQEGTVTVMP
jgi:plastocyanin